MSDILHIFLKYFFALILMSSTLLAALAAEGVYFCLCKRRMSRKNFRTPFVALFNETVSPVLMPDTACSQFALYGPAFAFAALMPICASIPFCTVEPVLDNGGDIVQIFQFALLSDLIAVFSLHSLGTASGRTAARNLFVDLVCTYSLLMACFASLSWYLEASGVSGDTFSLNTLSLVMQTGYVNASAVAGVLLFIILILGRMDIFDVSCGSIKSEGELFEYRGVQKAILLLWAIFRTFIIIALVTHIFFPWVLFQSVTSAGQGISWYIQALNFMIFWLTVIAVRVLFVPFCTKSIDFLHKRLEPTGYSWLLVPCLTLVAISLVMYAAISISSEIASY